MSRTRWTSLVFLAVVLHGSGLSAQEAPARDGVWFNIGLGVGGYGCESCTRLAKGAVGQLGVGASLSPQVMVGLVGNGWVSLESASVGVLVVAGRYYPSATGEFFLTGGLGVGSARDTKPTDGRVNARGMAGLIGVGWDTPTSRYRTVTAFLHLIALDRDLAQGRILVGGLSVTFR
jgi:hypothetical protein